MIPVPSAMKAVFPGLLAAQGISALLVYRSNISLMEGMEAVRQAGYLPVPNALTVSRLGDLGPAFFGGLFFTLTVGALLSVAAFAAAWIRVRLYNRSRAFPVFLLGLWGLGLLSMNAGGILGWGSALFLIVPAVVFFFSPKDAPDAATRGAERFRALTTLLPLVFLGFLWGGQADSRLFMEIRDRLLLAGPIGRSINDFYYEYTLYPAEAFKAPAQKTIRTVAVVGVEDPGRLGRLEKALASRDYIPVILSDGRDPDLVLKGENGNLAFQHLGRTVLRAGLEEFFSRTGHLLGEFSRQADRNAFFRWLTFFSLFVGFPVLLYLTGYSLLFMFFHPLVGPVRASAMAGGVCLLAGILLFYPVAAGRDPNPQDLPTALTSRDLRKRVDGLRFIVYRNEDITRFPSWEAMIKSPAAAERYWLARALEKSPNPEADAHLVFLLDDPAPNVVCAAFHALGERGFRKAIPVILEKLRSSNHWYCQGYAYNALRRLGWNQAEFR